MKQQRQSAIRELLGASGVPSQDELRVRLASRGFHVTQATLSRDMRELQLSKGPSGYRLPPPQQATPVEDDSPEIDVVLRSFGLEVRQALNLVVLVTRTGGASLVASSVDYEDWSEVVGTIAGDDTVLIICPDVARADAVRERIADSLG